MKVSLDRGSFRDRRAQVYLFDDNIIRLLDETAYKNWCRFSKSKFFKDLHANGSIVKTEEIAIAKIAETISLDLWSAALKHEPIPFISYPYEWSFSQMKDAALFHLSLLKKALDEGFILKDSSAFNIQWRGTKPAFIDITSFEKYNSGEPWVGYRQFCEMFLNPLFLTAYKGVPFQHWMRGRIDGIETSHIANLFTMRDIFRRGVFSHIYLHAKLQSSLQSSKISKSSIRKAGFNKKMIMSNIQSLQRSLRKLKSYSSKSHWVNYSQDHSYGETDYQIKKNFVNRITSEKSWGMVWDLGCNTGDFSRIAANNGAYVVAMDADKEAVNALFERSKAENDERILPLNINIIDPSPSQGWRGQERKSIVQRGTPDLVLALALLHHVVIGGNIPLSEFVEWLRTLEAAIVLEFISKNDEMSADLLRNKEDLYYHYTEEALEKCLGLSFTIKKKKKLKRGLRILYYATPKD